MIISKDMMKQIVEEAKLLEDIGDCVGVEIENNKGLFIEVVDYGDGKEYLIELNDIVDDDVYEPCKEYNAFAEFGNMDKLVESIEEYLQ